MREQLGALGLSVSEKVATLPFAEIWSVTLTCTAYPRLLAAGKGTSEAQARAGAYAELFERLLSGLHVRPRFGRMPACRRLRAAPTRWCSLDALPRAFVEHAPHGLHPSDRLACVPFDAGDDGRAWLPVEWIRLACGSNGLAAGNTAEEAYLNAGLEVLERDAIRRTFLATHPLPQIPRAALEGLPSAALLDAMTAAGLEVVVKDATFGGTRPVLAVVAHGREGIKWAFGAEPSLDLCLQRCVTELFQEDGASGAHHPHTPTTLLGAHEAWPPGPRRDRALRRFMSSRGMAPAPHALLLSAGEPRHRAAFVDELEPPDRAWRRVESLLRARFPAVYTRELDRMGVSVVRVYVPGASELHHLARFTSLRIVCDLERLGELLCRLPALSDEERVELTERLTEHLLDDPPPGDLPRLWSTLTGIEPSPADDGRDLSLYTLLGYLHLLGGRHEEAILALSRAAEDAADRGKTTRAAELRCTALAVRGLALGISEASLCQQLERSFSWLTARTVVRRVAAPDQLLRRLRLPVCGDCSGCELESACAYPGWSSVVRGLDDGEAPR